MLDGDALPCIDLVNSIEEISFSDCEDDENNNDVEEIFTFERFWIFEMNGQPGLWTEMESNLLEAAVTDAYKCIANSNNGFYKLDNVTVSAPDLFGGPIGSPTIRNFSIPILIQGTTNLTTFLARPGPFRTGRTTYGDSDTTTYM